MSETVGGCLALTVDLPGNEQFLIDFAAARQMLSLEDVES